MTKFSGITINASSGRINNMTWWYICIPVRMYWQTIILATWKSFISLQDNNYIHLMNLFHKFALVQFLPVFLPMTAGCAQTTEELHTGIRHRGVAHPLLFTGTCLKSKLFTDEIMQQLKHKFYQHTGSQHAFIQCHCLINITSLLMHIEELRHHNIGCKRVSIAMVRETRDIVTAINGILKILYSY